MDIDIHVEGPGRTYPPHLVEVRRLVDDPYVAVMRAGDPMAQQAEVAPADLATRRWVDNDHAQGPCRQVLLDACAQAGFVPQLAVETHDYQTALPFVATGIGITVLPLLGTSDLPQGLTARPVVSPTPVRHISVAVRRSLLQHPVTVCALDALEGALADQ